MLNTTKNNLTKEQLLACLNDDEIEVDVKTINEAKNDDGQALHEIGLKYDTIKKDYPKAMAWYRLAANQNHSFAYNCIGTLYFTGEGASQDYLTAMDCFLKAAGNDSIAAMNNIGDLFLNGQGIPVDKYKALEWFIKSGKGPEDVRQLNEEGYNLTKEDKNKTVYQLINEAEDAIREERKKREEELNSSTEKEIEILRTEIQKLQNESQQKQRRIDLLEQEKERNIKEEPSPMQMNNGLEQQLKETINSLNTTIGTFSFLVQSKDNEINYLKKINHLEKEELKRKIEELERGAQTPISPTDGNNTTNNNSSSITSNTLNSNSNLGNNDTSVINTDGIKLKVEHKYEGSDSILCKTENKKRRVTFNGT